MVNHLGVSKGNRDYKRAAVIDEAIRRVGLMRRSEIETEFAAIENCLEIRLRFIADPFRPARRQLSKVGK